MTSSTVPPDADVIAVETGELDAPRSARLKSRFANRPVVVPNDPDRIAALLS